MNRVARSSTVHDSASHGTISPVRGSWSVSESTNWRDTWRFAVCGV
ncbi:hypothetical protein [Amycolatopsis thermoflava]